jgi:hypothetical protein
MLEVPPMNARNYLVLLLPILMSLSTVVGAQRTLTVEGADDSQQEYTLEGASLLEILAGGNVEARVTDDVACGGFEACDSCCDPCDACDSCCDPCDCDIQLQFDQFTVSSGGTSVGSGGQLTLSQGDLVQVRWQAPGAFSCSGSGLSGTAWDGGQPTFSALTSAAGVSFNTSALAPAASPYTLLLTCSNASTQQQRQITMVVEEQDDPPPPECQGVPSLEQATNGGIVRSANIILDDSTANGFIFEEVFRDPFPGRSGMQRRIRLLPDTYASLRFRTPGNLNPSHDGGFPKEVLLGTPAGPSIMTISTCQGDFDPASVDPGCYRRLQGSSTLRWTGDPDSEPFCSLEPDTVYYLNFVYTNDDSGTPPEQIEWACGFEENPTRCGQLYTPSFTWSPDD